MIFYLGFSLLQIVNWKTHLKFPEEAGLSPEAKDLISRLLCNVNNRLGSKGAHEIKVLYGVLFFKLLDLLYYIFWILSLPWFWISLQAHRFFKGVEWDKLYHIEAAFIPEVNDELDTQNFEKFDEVCVSWSFSCLFCINIFVLFSLSIFSHFTFCACSLTAKFDRPQKLVHGGR